MRPWLLPLVSLLLALVLVGSNIAGYIGAEPKMKMSETLLYLPDPVVARASCIGHRNLVGRLQWIDSFTYVSYQIDARNDEVAGDGRGGFTRLYETLIELDPKFEPYYDHAAMTISGLVSDHEGALVFMARGVLELPHSYMRWQNYAAHLSAYYDWDTRKPRNFEAVLKQWARNMRTEAERVAPEKWLQAIARREGGLSQIDYWAMRLRQAKPKTKMSDLAESVLREQLTSHHLTLLQATLRTTVQRERELLLADLDQARLPPAQPLGPLVTDDTGTVILDRDPYGWPYRVTAEGTVISTGQQYQQWLRRISTLNFILDSRQRRGLPPPDSMEAADTVLKQSIPETPADCQLDFDDGHLLPTVPTQDGWDLRARLGD